MTSDAAIFAEAERIRADLQTPARRDSGSQVPALPAVAVTGGPVYSSTSYRVGTGGPTPGPVSAFSGAAHGSPESVCGGFGAGVSSPMGGGEEPVVAADSEGRTGGDQSAPGAVPFTLPPTPPAWRP